MVVGVPLEESTKNGTLVSKGQHLPSVKTITTVSFDEVCVDYFATEKSAQAQCAVSYKRWDNANSITPCSSTASYGGGTPIDIALGAKTYDVNGNPIQVAQFAIYLNNHEIATTFDRHNVSTILRNHKNDNDDSFESCFSFSGTARVTGYFAAFGAV
ncbi:unnamed protein product [Rhizophagus irregularis]|nr:unnamed protein product [Rhizophagus irregularis]CAB5369729.1 unnamed protein product [Rhizophagus irregularis]